MDTIKVAIADDNVSAEEALSRMVNEDASMKIVWRAHTEREFYQHMREQYPDIVLFGTVLKKLESGNIRLAAVMNGARAAAKYSIRDSGQRLGEADSRLLERKITKLLRDLGIPANIRGYHYLRDAIALCVLDPEMMGSVTKVLYPAVAKKNHTTNGRVERAIRHAIEVTVDRGNPEVLAELYMLKADGSVERPTNSAFIAYVADKLRLDWLYGEQEKPENKYY